MHFKHVGGVKPIDPDFLFMGLTMKAEAKSFEEHKRNERNMKSWGLIFPYFTDQLYIKAHHSNCDEIGAWESRWNTDSSTLLFHSYIFVSS